jgi:hypothetical protein
VLSVLLVAALILAINFAPVPGAGALALGLAAVGTADLQRDLGGVPRLGSFPQGAGCKV